MPESVSALLALWNDVEPALEADYEDWHAHEHVPERLTVPGMLWGRRYAALPGSPGPRYLTLYGLRDAAVLDGEPYRRLLREPTPMSARMRPALRNVSRWVCRLREQDGAEAGTHLAVWALPDDPDAARSAHAALARRGDLRGHLLAERMRDARPLPWLAAGQDAAVDGDWLLCATLDDPRPADAARPGGYRYRRLPA